MNRIPNLVSVIIPCYNHGKFIHEALESIINQTYQNFEIIIVDDGSNETNTIKILDNLDFPKTKVYRKINGGPATARNFGIQKSRGQYILTLDADDKFLPTFVEKGVGILENRAEIGMVTSYLVRIYKDRTEKIQLSGGDVSSFVVKNNACASLLFRYCCWEDANGYDENIPGFEDWDFALSVTKMGWIVYSIPEYLYYYRKIEWSQNHRDEQIRPEIMKYLTNKHESVFKDNITNVIHSKELQIQRYSKIISNYKNSYSQKIGNTIIKPIKVLKNLLFIKKNPFPKNGKSRFSH